MIQHYSASYFKYTIAFEPLNIIELQLTFDEPQWIHAYFLMKVWEWIVQVARKQPVHVQGHTVHCRLITHHQGTTSASQLLILHLGLQYANSTSRPRHHYIASSTKVVEAILILCSY